MARQFPLTLADIGPFAYTVRASGLDIFISWTCVCEPTILTCHTSTSPPRPTALPAALRARTLPTPPHARIAHARAARTLPVPSRAHPPSLPCQRAAWLPEHLLQRQEPGVVPLDGFSIPQTQALGVVWTDALDTPMPGSRRRAPIDTALYLQLHIYRMRNKPLFLAPIAHACLPTPGSSRAAGRTWRQRAAAAAPAHCHTHSTASVLHQPFSRLHVHLLRWSAPPHPLHPPLLPTSFGGPGSRSTDNQTGQPFFNIAAGKNMAAAISVLVPSAGLEGMDRTHKRWTAQRTGALAFYNRLPTPPFSASAQLPVPFGHTVASSPTNIGVLHRKASPPPPPFQRRTPRDTALAHTARFRHLYYYFAAGTAWPALFHTAELWTRLTSRHLLY